MRHQRQGWRRLVALSVAMVGALAIAPGIASASPSSGGHTGLDISLCKVTVVVDWSGQPGKLKTYTVELTNDSNPTVTTMASGAFSRSAHMILQADLTDDAANSNTFRAITHVFDGKGIEQETWASGDVAVPCI
jgi:hypothetical protein